MPTKALLDRRALLAWLAWLALLEQLGPWGLPEQRVWTAQLAHKAPKVHRAQLAHKDRRVHRVWLAWA